MASSSPPSPEVKYRIEYSADGGKVWKTMIGDWTIARQGEEPKDFWSQSFCYGSTETDGGADGKVRVRFSNNGGKKVLRAELHLIYATESEDATEVTFAWRDSVGEHVGSHTFSPREAESWLLPTGNEVETKWVEFAPVR